MKHGGDEWETLESSAAASFNRDFIDPWEFREPTINAVPDGRDESIPYIRIGEHDRTASDAP